MSAAESRPIESDLRQLALVDRILGLEAQLAEASVRTNPPDSRIEALEDEVLALSSEVRALTRQNEELRQRLAALHRTATWRTGRVLLTPVRIVRSLLRRTS